MSETRPRTVLFLQGPPSSLWAELADALAAAGAGVRRVDLNLGDQLFWRRPGSVRYRGRLAEWPRWLRHFVRREGVTDIVYFNDRPPYHRLAAAVARSEGLAAWAVEFGYLRPDWVTMEPEGGGAWSHFPADPERLRKDLPRPDMQARYAHPFWREAVAEVAYNLIATAGRPLFPFYADDKYYWPVLDYLAWLPKFARGPRARAFASRTQRRLLDGEVSFDLLALQMQSDYQLRHSAPFRSQAQMIRHVIESFARGAPPDRHLLIKEHPLDNGWVNWTRLVARLSERLGVRDRVVVIEGGDLGRLVRAARGVIVANSTVGLHALQAMTPTIALGAAIYDMPGLTHRTGLDRFWTEPESPSPELVGAFCAELAATIQVKGSVYHPVGRRMAAEQMARRLLQGPPADLLAGSGRRERLRRLARARRSFARAQP